MSSSAAVSSLQTPLTQEFPVAASLSRNDIDALLAGWNPARADAAWYRSDVQAPLSTTASSSRSVPPPPPPIGEEAFEAFVEQLPQVKALRQESQRLLRLSEERAARNTTLQPNLERLRNETQELFDRAKSLEKHWATLERDTNEEYRRFTPGTLLFNLTQSASKLHDESESLASAFVEGLPLEVAAASSMRHFARGLTPPDSGTATPTGRDPDGDATFVRRYRALRTTYHRRNLVADRWARGTVTWRDD